MNGTIHAADAVAAQAKTDLTTAYNDAAGRAGGASVSGDLGGQTLTAGVYKSESSLGLTGILTLDAQGDGNAVFIFQAGSTLTTASASQVRLIGGADACNVFWQVGSSATLGTNSVLKGNVLALTSITATTGSTIDGRTLARNGAATLDTNTITMATCPTTSTTGATGPGGTTTGTTDPGGETTATTDPGGATTGTTDPGAGTTPTTDPDGGTTATTDPDAGTTATNGVRGATAVTAAPGAPALARSGTGSSDGLAVVGITLTMTGSGLLLVARRREQTAHRS